MRRIQQQIVLDCTLVTLAIAIVATAAWGQGSGQAVRQGSILTLAQARETARRTSPELTAARETMQTFAARERQASAFPNPILSYQREQTSGGGVSNVQNIASIDQPIEFGSVRAARVDAASLRREAAEARFIALQSQLDYDVARAYALAAAADARASLSEQAAASFLSAQSQSQARLAEGDVSGYSHRRIQLETARYMSLRAEANLERRSARLALAALLGVPEQTLNNSVLALTDSISTSVRSLTADSLRVLAAVSRADLRAATLEAEAAATDARVIALERIPVPEFSAGFKNERAGPSVSMNGFIAGVALSLPLWDRKGGTIAAADAEGRRRVAESEIIRRRVNKEVDEAAASLAAIVEQIEILRPQLGNQSANAIRAAQTAYAEGEIPLVEWLDAVRAYHEAESSYAMLRAETLIRLAALERAVGTTFSRSTQ